MIFIRSLIAWFLEHYGIKISTLGFTFFQLIYVTTELKIADYLSKGAKSCHELAIEMKVDEKSLLLILNLLKQIGVVLVDKTGNYHITSVGNRLRSDTANSLRGTILSSGSFVYQNWGNLLYTIETGAAASEKTFNMDIYKYLAENPKASDNFNLWMTETTREWIFPAISTYDFSQFNKFVDVGGNTGYLTLHILKKYPQLEAIIFDLEEVFNQCETEFAIAENTHRYKIEMGNFFESIPQGGDLYIISRVLLNWNDEDAIKILTNCRQAMEKSAKLLIIDFAVSGSSPFELMASLHSLVMNGQQIRTVEEYSHLLQKAGFSSPKLIKTGSIIKLIEALAI